jgi:hypothetical protein
MTHLWNHARPCAAAIIAFTVVASFNPSVVCAVDLDLAGKAFQNGGKIAVNSTSPVPAALLYDVRLEASGTGTGTFEALLGSGDLATRLEQLEPGASRDLRITLANLSGKLPVKLGQTTAFQQLFNVPLGNGITGEFTSKGKIKAQIAKDGMVKASATKMKFTAKDQNQAKVVVDGAYTIDTGKLVVEPSPATSATPQPDFILLLNTRFTIGNDEYNASAPGTVDVVPLKRGRTKTDFFIVQNDGPSSDTFIVRALFSPPGISLRVFDGKTDITAQVSSSGGYVIENLPSAGTKLFRMSVKLEKEAVGRGTLSAGVRVSRSADENVSDTGGISVFAR